VNGDEISDEQFENQPEEVVLKDGMPYDIINDEEVEIEGVPPTFPPVIREDDEQNEVIDAHEDANEVPAGDVSVVDITAEEEEPVGEDQPQPIIDIDEVSDYEGELNVDLIEPEAELDEEVAVDEVEREMDEEYGPSTSNYGLRP
jgi:hypothetical protein